jgi:hypothetical protein
LEKFLRTDADVQHPATWRMAIPEKHLIVIALTNLQGARPQYLAADIATHYEPSLVAAATH